jgi:hypothetical protein
MNLPDICHSISAGTKTFETTAEHQMLFVEDKSSGMTFSIAIHLRNYSTVMVLINDEPILFSEYDMHWIRAAVNDVLIDNWTTKMRKLFGEDTTLIQHIPDLYGGGDNVKKRIDPANYNYGRDLT